MKALHNFLEKKVKPSFDKGGKWEKLYPAYDAIETFLFTPGHVTKGGTHIKDAIDLKRTMNTVILALVPCLLFGIYNTGHQHYLALGEFTGVMDGFMDKVLYGAWIVLPMVIVSYAVGLGVEFTFAVIKKHSVEEGYLVSGMLIPLIMPAEVPLWMVAIATIFAVIIGKEVFGGTGMNILNVALTARAFLFFAYPTKMSGEAVWIGGVEGVDGVTGATLLGQAANKVPAADMAMANGDVFSDVTMSSIMGFIPGSIGETSVIACLLGAALLLYTGIGSWRIMLSMLVGGVSMAGIFAIWPETNALFALGPVNHIVMGGFMFGMVFMATDPVTAAQTNVGKFIYGFFCGFFGIMIRVFNPAYPEGIMLAILFMNVMAPMIDHYVVEANIKRRNKRAAAALKAA